MNLNEYIKALDIQVLKNQIKEQKKDENVQVNWNMDGMRRHVVLRIDGAGRSAESKSH